MNQGELTHCGTLGQNDGPVTVNLTQHHEAGSHKAYLQRLARALEAV